MMATIMMMGDNKQSRRGTSGEYMESAGIINTASLATGITTDCLV